MFLSERSERNQRIAKGEPHEISALKRLISYDVSPLDSHYGGRGIVFAEKPFRRVFWDGLHNRAGRYALPLCKFESICNSMTAPGIYEYWRNFSSYKRAKLDMCTKSFFIRGQIHKTVFYRMTERLLLVHSYSFAHL